MKRGMCFSSSCFSCLPEVRKSAHTDLMLGTAIARVYAVEYGWTKWKSKSLGPLTLKPLSVDVKIKELLVPRMLCSILMTWLS